MEVLRRIERSEAYLRSNFLRGKSAELGRDPHWQTFTKGQLIVSLRIDGKNFDLAPVFAKFCNVRVGGKNIAIVLCNRPAIQSGNACWQ